MVVGMVARQAPHIKTLEGRIMSKETRDMLAEQVRSVAEMLSGEVRENWRAENGYVYDEEAGDWGRWCDDQHEEPGTWRNLLDVDADPADDGPMVGDAWDAYLMSDVLDVRYVVGADRELREVEVLMCCGGPNIWANLTTGEVRGNWGGEIFVTHFDDSLDLEDYMREMWEAGA